MCRSCQSLIKAIDAYVYKADARLAGSLGKKGYVKPKRTIKYMQNIEDGLTEALIDETAYIIGHIEESVDLDTFAREIWPGVQVDDVLSEKVATVFAEQFSAFMPEFVGYYLEQTDEELVFSHLSKKSVAWIEDWSEDLGKLMKLNSHQEIENILETGLEEGIGIEEFSRRIMESGIRDEHYKARRAALTEVLTAHRAAAQEAYMQSPAVERKGWKHTGEYRNKPRQNHVDMDGKIVRVNEPFELIGADGAVYYPMYPGDPVLPAEERINCHCIHQPIVNEEILGLPLEERQRLQEEAIAEMDDEWEKELDAQNRAKAGIEKADDRGGGTYEQNHGGGNGRFKPVRNYALHNQRKE